MKLTGWFKWFHGAINATNLAGAVDVVVVRHADGTMHASPFYVRFGKLDVINSGGKEVYVYINGKLVSMRMTLSEEGQAYFKDDVYATDHGIAEPNVVDSDEDDVDDASFKGVDGKHVTARSDESVINAMSNICMASDKFEEREILAKEASTQSKEVRQLNRSTTRKRRRLRPFMSPSKDMYGSDHKANKFTEHYREPNNVSVVDPDGVARYKRISEPFPLSSMLANKAKTLTQNDICFECLSALGRHECKDTLATQDEVSIVRCQSDSDLDKRGITEEATYFLTRGRRAISDLGINFQRDEEYDADESDDTKSWCTDYPNDLPSYVLRPSSSANVDLHSNCGDGLIHTLHEPFVFRIANIEQALYYLHYLKCEVQKLPLKQSRPQKQTDSQGNITYLLDDLISEKDELWISSTAKASTEHLTLHDAVPPTGLYLGDALQKAADDQELSSLYHVTSHPDEYSSQLFS